MVRNENIQGMAALAVEAIERALCLVHGGELTRAVEEMCAARAVINAYVIIPLEKSTGEGAYREGKS